MNDEEPCFLGAVMSVTATRLRVTWIEEHACVEIK